MDLPLRTRSNGSTRRRRIARRFDRCSIGHRQRRFGRALAAYLRSIHWAIHRNHRFVAGATDALTDQQQNGLRLFRTKARCTICHAEPLFTDEQFQNTGVAWRAEVGVYQDEGRFDVSRVERDRGKFKTPT